MAVPIDGGDPVVTTPIRTLHTRRTGQVLL